MSEQTLQYFIGIGKPEKPKKTLIENIKRAFLPKQAKEHWYETHQKEVDELTTITKQLTVEQKQEALEKLERKATKAAWLRVGASWSMLAVALGATYVGGKRILDAARTKHSAAAIHPIPTVSPLKNADTIKKPTPIVYKKHTQPKIKFTELPELKPIPIFEADGNVSIMVRPRTLVHSKFFKGGAPTEFYNLEYTPGMEWQSKNLRDSFQVAINNPPETTTVGFWSFGRLGNGVVQAINLTEGTLGASGTNRPFAETRICLLDKPTDLRALYAHGIRPLTNLLIDDHANGSYRLPLYSAVIGEIDHHYTLKSNIEELWKIHQNKEFRQLATRTAEAVLTKLSVINNPVIVEYAADKFPQHTLIPLLDTVHSLVMAVNPSLSAISAISSPTLTNNSRADLIFKNTQAPHNQSLYPSYIINAENLDIRPVHISNPPITPIPQIMDIYDSLHESKTDWVKNHNRIFRVKYN